MGSGSSAKKKSSERRYSGRYEEPEGESPEAALWTFPDDAAVERADKPNTPEFPAGRRSPRPEAAPIETSPRLGAARTEGHAETRLESVAESEAPNVDRDEELDNRSRSAAPDDELQQKLAEPVRVVASVQSPKEDLLTTHSHGHKPRRVSSDGSHGPQASLSEVVASPEAKHSKKRMSMPADVAKLGVSDAQEARRHRRSEAPGAFVAAGRQAGEAHGLPSRQGSRQSQFMPERQGSQHDSLMPERLDRRTSSKHRESYHTSLPEEHEAGHNARHSITDADHGLGDRTEDDELERPEVHHRRKSRASFMQHRSSMSENSSERRGSSKGLALPEDGRTTSKRSSVTVDASPVASRSESKETSTSRKASKSWMPPPELENPPLQIGDKVTTKDGPDADGPWRDMGNGTVMDKGKHAGTVMVKFASTGMVFEIKERNLLELKVKDEKDKRNASKEKMYDIKIDGLGVLGDPNMGIKVGDTVAFSTGGRGIVVKEGLTPGTVLVRFGELGIRSVPCNTVTKLKLTEEAEAVEDAAWKARFADSGEKKSYQLTLDEAMATFQEQYDHEKAMLEQAKAEVSPDDPMKGLRPGDYVMASDDGPWRELGVGLIKGPGPAMGTAMVQFDCIGDTWALKCEVLTKVKMDHVNWKKSKALDPNRKVSKQNVHKRSSSKGAES